MVGGIWGERALESNKRFLFGVAPKNKKRRCGEVVE